MCTSYYKCSIVLLWIVLYFTYNGIISWWHYWKVPRGSYPTPFLGYLVLWLGSVILKSRRPKKGVGYEPLGIATPTGLSTCLTVCRASGLKLSFQDSGLRAVVISGLVLEICVFKFFGLSIHPFPRPWHECMPTYVQSHTCMHTCIHGCMLTCTHAYIYIYIYIYIYMRMHAYMHAYTYRHIQYIHIHIHTLTYTYIHTHTHTHALTYTYIHTPIQTHTYTYIHIQV